MTKILSIKERIFSVKNSKNEDHKNIRILGISLKIRRYIKEYKEYKKRKKENFAFYNNYIEENLKNNYNLSFVKETTSSYDKKQNDPLLLAYYLTQYHNTEINNKNFGKGFTEWTNVAKAKPLFEGHYQPHIPIDVGFYDLAHDTVMYRQIELAKKYGIGGFCFYYYWFSGERVLEKPLFNFLNNKELDMPFCLFWANETWQRRWFGGNKEILIEHKFDITMVEHFFYDILPFFKDERYIKINNKPFLILYHYHEFKPDELKNIISKFNDLTKENGFNGIYFVGQGYNLPNTLVEEYGLHAVSEFSPSGMSFPKYTMKDKYIYPEYKGNMYDIKPTLKTKKWIYSTNYTLYKGVFTAWDNTPRSFTNSNIYIGSSPQLYKQWLKETISWTKENNTTENQIIFINAWNEWGEGAHLEPDLKYGYAYLQATKEAIEESR